MKRKFLYSESLLSEVLGLSRAQLKTCRVKGEWKSGKGKGRPVQLSQAGVDSVLKKYGIEEANLDGARIKGSGESQPAINQEPSTPPVAPMVPVLKLVHVSQLVPNKRILRAKNGTGEIYQVIVPSSEVWAIGDPLRIKPNATHQNYWQLEGKAPRWRGDRLYRHTFA